MSIPIAGESESLHEDRKGAENTKGSHLTVSGRKLEATGKSIMIQLLSIRLLKTMDCTSS